LLLLLPPPFRVFSLQYLTSHPIHNKKKVVIVDCTDNSTGVSCDELDDLVCERTIVLSILYGTTAMTNSSSSTILDESQDLFQSFDSNGDVCTIENDVIDEIDGNVTNVMMPVGPIQRTFDINVCECPVFLYSGTLRCRWCVFLVFSLSKQRSS
jgi:hypothetical protein